MWTYELLNHTLCVVLGVRKCAVFTACSRWINAIQVEGNPFMIKQETASYSLSRTSMSHDLPPVSSLTLYGRKTSSLQRSQNINVQWSWLSYSNGFSIYKNWFIFNDLNRTFGLIFSLTTRSMGGVILFKTSSARPLSFSALFKK